MSVQSFLAGVKIVDFHVHAFPDAIADRAICSLGQVYGRAAISDGTIAGLTAIMERVGLDRAVIQPVATKPSQVQSINDWAASINDPRIICFGCAHPDYPNAGDEVDRLASLGIPGIKIQANWQNAYVDDRRMYPIYEAAQGRLIIMFHAGKEFMPVQDVKATPERIANVVRDFPKLTVVAAHMGGFLMWDEVEEHLLGKNVCFDTSACFPEQLPDERFLGMIRRHGAEKVLFATDMPLNEPLPDLERLARIGLKDDEFEAIVWGNARRLLKDRLS